MALFQRVSMSELCICRLKTPKIMTSYTYNTSNNNKPSKVVLLWRLNWCFWSLKCAETYIAFSKFSGVTPLHARLVFELRTPTLLNPKLAPHNKKGLVSHLNYGIIGLHNLKYYTKYLLTTVCLWRVYISSLCSVHHNSYACITIICED